MDQRLHQQAKGVASELLEHLTTKPTAFLVAVLWHDIPMPVIDACRESFMFVKCTGKISVGKVRESYLSREEAPSDILLHMGSTIPSDTAKVSELVHFGDKVIVFHALGVVPANTTDTMNSTSNGPTSAIFANLSVPSRLQFAPESKENGVSGALLSGALTSVRQSSVSSRSSVNQSGLSSASSARRAPSSSSVPGHTPGASSPLTRPAPAPSTPASAIPRASVGLPTSKHHSPAYSTPTRYAQASVLPSVKNEPVPAPPYGYVSYTPAPHAQGPQPLQASPRLQGPYYGTPHVPAQYGQPNGNGHGPSTTQVDNTHSVSLTST
ncbi:unnamed protein product [Aureobasidium vineae]|uniref:Uncharacterized protein n=1 Tax=Aureobasidium vineae TaxID=2773715 RepID=A0A9N8JXJ9_9PEZI|nr:unnamed protein product [Aureobasidium vineae]